jgi:hypothetical protein
MVAATKTNRQQKFGVTEVARRLNRTTGRIRQLCLAHNIGICYGDRYRELSEADVRQLASLLRPDSQ